MADTLSLDTAVQFAIERGASVRLVGDDQQLGAIGAGGVIRDIIRGALRLTEHRFTGGVMAGGSRIGSRHPVTDAALCRVGDHRGRMDRRVHTAAVGDGGALEPCSSVAVISSMIAARSALEGSPQLDW
jgi:AAA domain